MSQTPRSTSRTRSSPGSTGSQLRSRLQHHRAMAGDSLHRLYSAPVATLMTITVIAIALLLPALLSVAMSNAARLSGSIDNINQISIYLRPDVDEARAIALSEALLARPAVRQVDHISAEQALQEFREQSGLAEAVDALGSNPLPTTLLVSPHDLDTDQLSALLEELLALPEVESAQLDLQWLQRLQALTAILQRAVTALLLILCIAVLFLVGNTLRMAIEARRAEILVVKLVGGSNSFVARPFLYSGVWYGLFGGLLAWLALLLLLLAFRAPTTELLALYGSDFRLQGPGLGLGLMLIAGGAVLGWLGAILSVIQHLAAIEPR